MSVSSEIRIDPTPAELDALLNLPRVPDLDAALECPEGYWTWRAFVPDRIPGEEEGHTHLAWWTDYLGRRHVRVVKSLVYAYSRQSRIAPVGSPKSWPILRLYPEFGFEIWHESTCVNILMICPCGAAGTPEAIGWMGTECGPCHDRRATGELGTRPWDIPVLDIRVNSFSLCQLEFHPTKPYLYLFCEDGSQIWNYATGELQAQRDLDSDRVPIWSPDGTRVLASGHREPAYILDADTLEEEARLPPADRLYFSPSQRWLVGSRQGTLWVREWGCPEPREFEFSPGGKYQAFSSDERTLYEATETDQIRCHDLETGTTRVLSVELPGQDQSHPLTSLHVGPEDTLLLGTVSVHWLVDARTGTVRHGRRVAPLDQAIPLLQTPDRDVLINFSQGKRQMAFLTIPELAIRLRLAWYGSDSRLHATNGHWLAIAGRYGVRLVPWRPLLDWYTREGVR